MQKQARIALVDANNFYVSCERVFRPDLNDRPVMVLSNNDGCVVARSQQVKDLGIKMGVPLIPGPATGQPIPNPAILIKLYPVRRHVGTSDEFAGRVQPAHGSVFNR